MTNDVAQRIEWNNRLMTAGLFADMEIRARLIKEAIRPSSNDRKPPTTIPTGIADLFPLHRSNQIAMAKIKKTAA